MVNEMAEQFDVLVLGAGNAGIGAASVARAAGLSGAIVEGRAGGGTWAVRGLVPAAQALHQISRAPIHQIELGPARLDWGKLIARERSFVEGASAGFEAT